jgi:uncharacterized protein (TIGR00369 family)
VITNKSNRTVGMVSRDALLSEDGLTFQQGLLSGRHPFPPFADFMDIELSGIEEGRAAFIGRPSERFFNPIGTIQGGWAATILDAAMGFATHATLKLGETFTTLEMKVNYVRPVLPSSAPVRCEAKVIHRGGRIATSEAQLFDGSGKLLAHGSETCMIFAAGAA